MVKKPKQQIGIIEKWVSNRGYGFIRPVLNFSKPQNVNQKIFVHYSNVVNGDYRGLEEGTKVTYKTTVDPKIGKIMAYDVQATNDGHAPEKLPKKQNKKQNKKSSRSKKSVKQNPKKNGYESQEFTTYNPFGSVPNNRNVNVYQNPELNKFESREFTAYNSFGSVPNNRNVSPWPSINVNQNQDNKSFESREFAAYNSFGSVTTERNVFSDVREDSYTGGWGTGSEQDYVDDPMIIDWLPSQSYIF